jgi:subtilisin-like proprotein convertase family protein
VTLDVGRFTYSASGLPVSIPDAGDVVSTINVTDSYCIGDVDVELAIDHTWVGDLCVTLEHNGIPVQMIQRMGEAGACHSGAPFGCDVDNFSIKLDDAGSGGAIESQCTAGLASPPSYTPNESLAAFNGEFVTGEWTLTVLDNAGSDVGSLVSWTLKIASAGTSCPPMASDVDIMVPEDVSSNIVLDGTSQGMDHDYIIESLPTHGDLSDPNGSAINSVPYTLLLQGDTVAYNPDDTYTGPDSFTYRVNDGQNSNVATVNITVSPPVAPILLVDDDNNAPDVRSYYTAALNSIGAVYDVVDTAGGGGNPTAGDLAGRELVIWFSGDNFGGTTTPLAGPTLAGEATLATWLEEGNCLFISSQDYLWDRGGANHDTPTPFMSSYLGVALSESDEGFTGATGQGTVYSGFGPYTFTFPSGFSNFTDNIEPSGTGASAFTGPDDVAVVRDMAVTKDGTTWRTTYWGFPLEAIASASERQTLVQAMVDWCAELDPKPNPCPADIVPPGGDGQVSIADITSVLSAFNTVCNDCPQDVVPQPDGDGQVSIADINFILTAFGPCD